MSGISGTGSSITSGTSAAGTASTAAAVGNNVAPITFSGIASGVDYNSIIAKLTSLTLAPNTQYNNQITQLNAKNAELIKINTLLASVQATLTTLSDPATFNAFTGTSTDAVDATASQVSGETAVPGAYSVQSTHLATATSIESAPITGAGVNLTTALVSAGTALTPTNGPGSQNGLITVDGVAVNYDVASQSLSSIVADIQTAVQAVDSGFSITLAANGEVTLSSTDQPISLGSAVDRGNLASVLKLNTAQINNSSGPPYSVASAGPIGGVNVGQPLDGSNHAGFSSAVTAGAFTINGVQITVDPSNDNVASVLAKINNSAAGVNASYDSVSGTFSLTNKSTGALGIAVGSASDTSNFLTAAGLTASTLATTTVGQQAYVSVRSNDGLLHTVYSDSNAVQGAIPGIAVNVSGDTSVPFTINVALNAQPAISAINAFVTAYNSAVGEIALATAPPIVQQSYSSTGSTTSSSSVIASGGVLYGDPTVQELQYRLTSLVQGVTNTGSTSYNSLDAVGLSLDSQHTVYQSNTNSYGGTVNASTSGPIATSVADGTDGKLNALDVTKFTAAFNADPSAVAALFTSTASNGIAATSAQQTLSLSYSLGSYLTGITGFPTTLVSGLVGSIPVVSILQSDQNADTAEIAALNQSIKLITDKANAQADQLRQQATASEALISQYQSEQSAVNQLNGSSSSG